MAGRPAVVVAIPWGPITAIVCLRAGSREIEYIYQYKRETVIRVGGACCHNNYRHSLIRLFLVGPLPKLQPVIIQ